MKRGIKADLHVSSLHTIRYGIEISNRRNDYEFNISYMAEVNLETIAAA